MVPRLSDLPEDDLPSRIGALASKCLRGNSSLYEIDSSHFPWSPNIVISDALIKQRGRVGPCSLSERLTSHPRSPPRRPRSLFFFLLYQMLLAPTEALAGIAMNAMNSGLDYEVDQFAVELTPSLGTRRWRTWATTSGVPCACAWYCTRSPPSLREAVAGSTRHKT
ncbi:hypothetical protein C8Q76DRAFT_74395 [Earliella scabrosa]|nr:hypothetical protein C8Q76DRAFT_74395 [Earliella scabrosa]